MDEEPEYNFWTEFAHAIFDLIIISAMVAASAVIIIAVVP